ncbi:MAG: hypothetical protein IKW43_08460 [Bacteroidaceae bacterium]|nr:hypothetical protein [Bacteroidaceae bacterium]
MKIVKLIVWLFLVLGIVSCKSESSSNIETKDDAFKTMTAKQIVESGVSVNVTREQLQDMERESVSRSGREERPLGALAGYRAAHYRFVTHAKQDKNGIVTWTAKCGADLNISDDLFNAFVKEFEEVNAFIQDCMDKGIKCDPIWIDEEYLYHVIDDGWMEDQLRIEKMIKEQGFGKVMKEWFYDRTSRRWTKKEIVK